MLARLHDDLDLLLGDDAGVDERLEGDGGLDGVNLAGLGLLDEVLDGVLGAGEGQDGAIRLRTSLCVHQSNVDEWFNHIAMRPSQMKAHNQSLAKCTVMDKAYIAEYLYIADKLLLSSV